jgi:AmmeMemoRadiSam system protein B
MIIGRNPLNPNVFFFEDISLCGQTGRRIRSMSVGMKIRKRLLPAGWYPENADEIRSLVAEWTKLQKSLSAYAAVAPHAGWYFSGDLAARAVWSLRECDTVVVLGGHLGYGNPVHYAPEDSFDCTVRIARNDTVLLDAVKKELIDVGINEFALDAGMDNSVEIILPLASLRFPEAKIVWLRVPPDFKARELGSALARAASSCGRSLSVIASTDLTHYGPNYGFMPHGVGESACDWVRNENDRGLINAALSMDAERVLSHARERFSACSAGAVAAAISYSLDSGAKRGILIGHKLSYDVHPDRSFVGYAGIAYVK